MSRAEATEERLRREIRRGGTPPGGAAAAHPSLDRLLAYHAGELPEGEAEELRDHLALCRACTADLLDLGDFAAAGEEEPAPRDLRAAAFWRSLSSRLPGRESSRLPLAAAALVVLCLGLGGWGLHQRFLLQELRQGALASGGPQADARIEDLHPQSSLRSGGAAPRVLPVPAEGGHLTLVLNLPQAPAAEILEVEIEGPGGQLLWRGELRLTAYGTLHLGLPGGFLAAGEHRIRVYADDRGQRRLLEVFPLTFAPSGDQG